MPTDAPTAAKVLRPRVRADSDSWSHPFRCEPAEEFSGQACTAEARCLKHVVKSRADRQVGPSVGLNPTTFVWF